VGLTQNRVDPPWQVIRPGSTQISVSDSGSRVVGHLLQTALESTLGRSGTHWVDPRKGRPILRSTHSKMGRPKKGSTQVVRSGGPTHGDPREI
jgi:hypothetical protein